jgi:hypothetical protein
VSVVTQHDGVLHCGSLLPPVPLHLKIAAGLATGAIAITVASPTDLVKVRPWGFELQMVNCYNHAV